MDAENVIYIFAYNFANVGMKPVCKGWNIFVHLYNKKVLKYGEQDVTFVNFVWVIVEVSLVQIETKKGTLPLCLQRTYIDMKITKSFKKVKILFLQNRSKSDKQFVKIFFWVKKLSTKWTKKRKKILNILFLQNRSKSDKQFVEILFLG